MRGIGVLTSLEELYLSQNGIKKIEDLQNLSVLKVLDLGYNFVEKVRAVGTNPRATGPLAPMWHVTSMYSTFVHSHASWSFCSVVMVQCLGSTQGSCASEVLRRQSAAWIFRSMASFSPPGATRAVRVAGCTPPGRAFA